MTPIDARPTQHEAQQRADELREQYERVWIDREIIDLDSAKSVYAFTIYAEGNKMHTREDWEAMKEKVDPYCEMGGWEPVASSRIYIALGIGAVFCLVVLYWLFHMLDLAVMAFFKWWGA